MLARRLSVMSAVLFVGAISAMPARAQTSLGLIDPAKLTWGNTGAFPPFEALDNGKPIGFDIDLVDALRARLNLQSAPVMIDFKGLIPALLGGRLDAIVSGVYINPERSQVIDLIPYLRIGDYITVPKGNPLHLAKLLDLCGHKIAAAVGTIFEKQAQKLAADCKTAGQPDLTIISPPATPASVLMLKEGRADAIIVPVPTALELMKGTPGVFETAGEAIDNNTLLGIGVAKGRPALKEALETALKAVVADGTYGKIIEKYGLPKSSSLF
ncbi:MAG: ABC transporter substrate-binding protein [Alphaproteobacteria bacterium]|nr:ABC transporter substrate-binding protein [Alphaproteobacteria bacterium]